MQVSQHWRLQSQRYNLVGETCDSCGVKLFPPRDVCLECEAPAKELYTFTGRGEVYSYTTIYDAPAGFEQLAPYTVALIKLEEGPLVTAQLTDIGAQWSLVMAATMIIVLPLLLAFLIFQRQFISSFLHSGLK